MKQLIVNADDFGYTRGVNQGILRCYASRESSRSTTIMANGQAFDAAVEIARAHPELGVGVHIVLVGEPAVAPRAKLPLLADALGQLPRTIRSLILKSRSSSAFSREIETEMRAQIDRVRAAGIRPTHLDTHKHTHIYPPVMKVLAKVAQDYGITRVRMPFEASSRGCPAARRRSRCFVGAQRIRIGVPRQSPVLSAPPAPEPPAYARPFLRVLRHRPARARCAPGDSPHLAGGNERTRLPSGIDSLNELSGVKLGSWGKGIPFREGVGTRSSCRSTMSRKAFANCTVN